MKAKDCSSDELVCQLFESFLAEREDAPLDMEAFSARHPDRAAELRRIHSAWKRIEGAFGAAGRSQEAIEIDVESEVGSDTGLEWARSAPSQDLLERLGRHSPVEWPYRNAYEVTRGGMGAILRVWDEDLRRPLAMKVALGEGSPSRLRRFLEEAQVTSQLEHPGIVPVHQLGLDAHGRVFFTMPFVRGRNLLEVLEEEGPAWTRTRGLGVILKVCEALEYAHAKGVVHRDVKPSNVMVGRFGEVYLMDWGLAKLLGTSADAPFSTLDADDDAEPDVTTEGARAAQEFATLPGTALGTPDYMSPEQARGDACALDGRADVYSLGALLYHLLAGRPPFTRPGDAQPEAALERVLAGAPRPLARLAPEVAPELVAISEKAMARDLEQRYAGVAELRADLHAFLDQRAVQAYRTGPLVELRKWVVRNRAVAAVSVAAIVLVIAGLWRTARIEARIGAEKEAEAARAVTAKAFLRDTLFLAGEYSQEGRPLDLSFVLDWAAGEMEGAFEHQADTRAELTAVLGRAYLQSGRFERARDLLGEAHGLQSELHGERDPGTLETEGWWAIAMDYAGAPEAAQDHYLNVLAARDELYGRDHPATLLALSNVARMRSRQGRHDEADTLFEEALGGLRRHLGERDPEVLRATVNHAELLRACGRLDDARWELEIVLEGCRAELGEEHPETIGALNNLAAVERDAGRLHEAEALFDELLGLHRRLFGEEHPKTALARLNLGTVQRELGHEAQAARNVEGALAVLEMRLAPNHEWVLNAKMTLGTLRQDQRDFDGAAELFGPVLEGLEDVRGPDHPTVLAACLNLGEAERQRGNPGRAQELQERAAGGFAALWGADHAYTRKARELLDLARRDLGRE